MMKPIMILTSLVVTMLATLFAPVQPVAAQSGERCFFETNFCISGPIRAYWERNGGLPVFGFPISPQRVETVEGRTLQVQWFERDRLEIQADGLVTAGRLGARYLELDGRPWQRFPSEQPINSAECSYFAQTRFNVCGWFLGYWQRNGGLERFGYPISPVIEERIEGRSYRVQYFERRRMEYHPQNSFPYDVLLGLLGREVLGRETSAALPACAANLSPSIKAVYNQVRLGRPLGCPTLVPGNNLPAATQQAERGMFIWVDQAPAPPMLTQPARVFAIINPGPSQSFRVYADGWVAGQDPDQPAFTPPRAGLHAPWRGFGKVWAEDAELRNQLGWAIESPAVAARADYQVFDSGILVVYLQDRGVAYAFGHPAVPSDVQTIRP
ncbi:MAG: hypothetical protein AB4911_13330 [Oscillochloridaceae bacterium umkhey_bin13]